jgi:hypothetical protein
LKRVTIVTNEQAGGASRWVRAGRVRGGVRASVDEGCAKTAR